jgi:hypothetical protein
MWGFIVTIPIRLFPSSLPLSPLFTLLKTIARGFPVLFHIDTWSPSTIYCTLIPLVPLPPPTITPPHCAYFTVLVFIINIWFDIQRGISMYALCWCALLWFVQSLRILSLNPLPPTPVFQHLSMHILIYSTFTSCGMQYFWCFIIVFPFSLFLSSIK